MTIQKNYQYLLTFCLAFMLIFNVVACHDCDDESLSSSAENCSVKDDLKGVWEGTFDQFNFGEYPMIMDVELMDGCDFSGKLEWPTLNNSITVMEGYVENDTLYFTETAMVQGFNIVLDGAYIATFQDTETIEGEWYYPNGGNLGGTFSISKQ